MLTKILFIYLFNKCLCRIPKPSPGKCLVTF